MIRRGRLPLRERWASWVGFERPSYIVFRCNRRGERWAEGFHLELGGEWECSAWGTCDNEEPAHA